MFLRRQADRRISGNSRLFITGLRTGRPIYLLAGADSYFSPPAAALFRKPPVAAVQIISGADVVYGCVDRLVKFSRL